MLCSDKTIHPGEEQMWDVIESNSRHVSHDMPCLECGHAVHVFLPCDAECGCVRSPIPGRYAEDLAPLQLA